MSLPEKEKSPAANGACKNEHPQPIKAIPNRQLNFAMINAQALPLLPALLSRWLPGGVMRGAEYVVKNPTRADQRAGSFKVSTRTGRWADFSNGDAGGDIISLAAYLFRISQGEALRRVAGMLGVSHV